MAAVAQRDCAGRDAANNACQPDTQPDRGAIFLDPFQGAARSLGLTPIKGEVHDLEGIETSMAGLAKEPGGGVIVIPDAFFASHSTQIVALADRFRLPAVYPYRYYVAQGGLLSYGVTMSICFARPHPTSIASFEAQSRPICRSSNRPAFSLSST